MEIITLAMELWASNRVRNTWKLPGNWTLFYNTLIHSIVNSFGGKYSHILSGLELKERVDTTLTSVRELAAVRLFSLKTENS